MTRKTSPARSLADARQRWLNEVMVLIVAVAACTLLGIFWSAREAVLGHPAATILLLAIAVCCAASWLEAARIVDDFRRRRARAR